MLSRKTWKYMKLTLDSGYFYGVYNFKIEPKKDFYEFIPRKNVGTIKCQSIFFIITNFCSLIGYLTVGLLNYIFNDGKVEIATNGILLGVSSLIFLLMGLQYWQLYFLHEIISVVHKFVNFNNKLCE